MEMFSKTLVLLSWKHNYLRDGRSRRVCGGGGGGGNSQDKGCLK